MKFLNVFFYGSAGAIFGTLTGMIIADLFGRHTASQDPSNYLGGALIGIFTIPIGFALGTTIGVLAGFRENKRMKQKRQKSDPAH
jgi:hypothetical protein